MTAAALAFRFRVFIFVTLYVVGFLAPWDYLPPAGRHATLWLAASTIVARSHLTDLGNATFIVTFVALLCLAVGAALRVWGTAYLGSATMSGPALQGDPVVAAGPYRHLRNPLYLGTWLLGLGSSILMPASGALFFAPTITLFLLFLIFSEERFLSKTAGIAYEQYTGLVPRLLPRPVARIAASSQRPNWLQSLLAEAHPVAFTVCFAVLAWRYNAHILVRCLLICYGLSLVLRALIDKAPARTTV